MAIDNRSWILRLLDCTSQLLNVAFLNGDPNESISGRVWRGRHKQAIKIIDALFFWQYQHCKNAYKTDLLRNSLYLKRANR